MDNKYSVLMSVYYKEKPEYLQQSIESILNQTVPTDDFVLVCDGPLTQELDSVVAQYPSLHVIRLKENGGLGKALNEGMKHCQHDLIARMDSDDISRLDRCERELMVFAEHPEVDIVSGTIEEFVTSPDEVYSRRVLPETSEEIVEFAKKRNPFNHPAVMYRKSAVESAGGYKDFYLLEDYFLWVRMISSGSKCGNLEDIVVDVRTGNGMYRRRSNIRYLDSQRQFFKKLVDMGYISKAQALRTMTVRTLFTGLPTGVVKTAYLHFLRK